MKKLILTFAVMAVLMAASAQTYTLTTIDAAQGNFWGATVDTVKTSGQRLSEVIRVKSPSAMDLQFQVNFTKISGTVTGTKVVFLYSNDNSTWVRADSVNLAGDASAVHFKNIDDFNYSYIKLWGIGIGSNGLTRIKVYYSFRKE